MGLAVPESDEVIHSVKVLFEKVGCQQGHS